ncbi:hypothetical protein [Streptomyces globisporus]
MDQIAVDPLSRTDQEDSLGLTCGAALGQRQLDDVVGTVAEERAAINAVSPLLMSGRGVERRCLPAMSGILHDVGPAHDSGYRCNRA